MAQFDSLINLPLLWSLTSVLFFSYNISLNIIIPNFFGVRKFREKKLASFAFFKLFKFILEVRTEKSYNTFVRC